ncbi:hypothetical protein [Mycobacterium sp. IS-1590]|uniref:hypothetical protein n=1 Tax=Mycobacterium sp. IS-1590 TaxID=1772286 RepID=UPI0007DAC329|nr:hypothetical protein [Mycobacterium sp. IS-1590]
MSERAIQVSTTEGIERDAMSAVLERQRSAFLADDRARAAVGAQPDQAPAQAFALVACSRAHR